MSQDNNHYTFNYPLNKQIKINKKNYNDWLNECGNNNVFILEEYKGRKNSVWEYEVIEFFMKQLEKNHIL